MSAFQTRQDVSGVGAGGELTAAEETNVQGISALAASSAGQFVRKTSTTAYENAVAATFILGTSGTDFAVSSSGTSHTFNLPDASATARGVLTTGTQTIAGDKTFSDSITVQGSLVSSINQTISGDVTINSDRIFALGAANQTAFTFKSDTLAADTALLRVLIGTVEAQAIAADSLLISNTTSNGDIALYVSKAGNTQQVFFADGSTGDTALMASSGQSVDTYIAGVKEIDYATGAMAFQQATTISTTATTLTLAPATTLQITPGTFATNITGAAGTTNQALTVTNTSNTAIAAHSIVDIAVGGTTSTGDPQVRWTVPGGGIGGSWYMGVDNSNNDYMFIGVSTVVGAGQLVQLKHGQITDGPTMTVFKAAGSYGYGANSTLGVLELASVTLTNTATTTVTALQSWLSSGVLTLNQSGGAVTFNKAAGVSSVGATAGASVTLTHSSAFRALTGGAAVNVSGLYVEAQTAGTTGSYGSIFEASTTADIYGLTTLKLATGTGNLTLSAAAGNDVLIGDDETLIYADGGTGTIGLFRAADATVSVWTSKDFGEMADAKKWGSVQAIIAGETTAHSANNKLVGTSGEVYVSGTGAAVVNNKNWTAALGITALETFIRTQTGSTGVVTGGSGLHVQNASILGATMTNQYGIYIDALTAATNNYGIYIDTPTGTIADAIHVVGGRSFFGGAIAFGDETVDIGTTSIGLNDLHFGSGGIINFDGGDVTITHSANALDIDGGVIDFGSTPTVNGVSILTTAGGILTGNITLGEGVDPASIGIVVDASISADERYSGVTMPGTAGATLAFGDLCYLDVTATEWLLADADAASTSGSVVLGICVDASTDGAATSMLLMGTVRSAAFPASIALGAPVYVDVTAGDISATQPSGTDDVIRVVGWAVTGEPNTIYFNPSSDYITHT